MNEIYFTSEEKNMIKAACRRYTKQYLRGIQRAETQSLKDFNERGLAVLKSIEEKLQ